LRSRPYQQEQRHENVASFQARTILQRSSCNFAHDAREEAEKLPPGTERDDMLRKANRADTAAHLDQWANTPELRAAEIRLPA
jgi:hypothetical protein